MSNKYAVIGDIHDNYDKLVQLLNKLGLQVKDCDTLNTIDRTIVFVGDLVDRGDKPIHVLTLVMNMVDKQQALMVRGNHDDKLLRALKGHNLKMRDEMVITMKKIQAQDISFINRLMDFLESLPFYLSLDDDKLYIVHGAAPEDLQHLDSKKARVRALYGVTTGEYVNGFPVRLDWGKDYRGERHVIYGHQMVDTPQWVNKTIDIDTGCFETGVLSCVLWPEKDIISVENDM